MPDFKPRIVIDTNTFLRGLIARTSAAAKIRRAAERRVVVPLLSKAICDEYRKVLGHPAMVQRFPELTPELVEITMRRLRFIGDYVSRSKAHFLFPRDPTDAKFIEAAIALNASHVITSDKDLLSLTRGNSEAGRRFRQRLRHVEVLEASGFVEAFAESLDLE